MNYSFNNYAEKITNEIQLREISFNHQINLITVVGFDLIIRIVN